MKKSKPKQRTNWKQRALHCEEVIGVQNELARVTSEELRQYKIAYNRESDRADASQLRAQKAESALDESGKQVNALRFRAESAEKHNALLLEEREVKMYRGTVCSGCYQQKCHGECMAPVRFHGEPDPKSAEERLLNAIFEPAPTHWQRFKSWLGRWKVELLLLMLVLGILAGLVAFAYCPRS